MFLRLYLVRLKCILRNKENVFWNFMFPILLSTCYFFAFGNAYKTENYETISIAYVNEGEDSHNFEEVLKNVKLSEDKLMFDITSCDKDTAKNLLKDGEISAYIVGSEKPQLFIKANGISETIAKAFLDNYLQNKNAITTILDQNPNAINEGLLEEIMQYDNYVTEKQTGKKPDVLLILYYSLLAFTCIMAANGGLDEVINIQADQSFRAARVNVSPIRKMKLFLCNLLSAFTAQILSIIFLFIYMYFVLKVDFGESLGYLFFVCFLGTITGIMLGGTVGVCVKKKPEIKQVVLTAVTLTGGFLSGMMYLDMKYLIAEYAPIIAYINPVSLITDAMYSLYYYDTLERYFLNIGLLCLITIILGVISYLGTRRKNYANI